MEHQDEVSIKGAESRSERRSTAKWGMMETLTEGARRCPDRWLGRIAETISARADLISVDRSDLWALLDSLPVALLISADRTCSRMIGNEAARALLRAAVGSNLSQTAPEKESPPFQVFANGRRVPPDDLPMQRAARTGQPVSRSECEIRFADGSHVFISGHCIPLHDEAGQICGSLGAFIDVTEEHTAHENASLIASEMAHRVKNTVSLVQALAHGTIRRKLDPADYDVFNQRLINLAQAQDLVGKSRQGALSLQHLLKTTIGTVAQDNMSRVELAGPAVQIDADLALSLTMIFHELTTNARKYGALSKDGLLQVTWCTRGPIVEVIWREQNGSAITSGEPGFGSELIDRLFRTLPMGKFTRTYGPCGLTTSIQFAT
jgi:two-component sensor histidine kinase